MGAKLVDNPWGANGQLPASTNVFALAFVGNRKSWRLELGARWYQNTISKPSLRVSTYFIVPKDRDVVYMNLFDKIRIHNRPPCINTGNVKDRLSMQSYPKVGNDISHVVAFLVDLSDLSGNHLLVGGMPFNLRDSDGMQSFG